MINLATTPFRNERLPALVFGVAAVVTLVVTLAHVVAVVRLAQRRAGHEEIRRVEREVAQLREEASKVRATAPDKATLARWSLVRDLVDRRLFSWTRLFEQLETTLPRQVRLISLAPKVSKGEVTIGMTAAANPPGAGLELIDTLEKQGPFSDVYPLTNRRTDTGDEEWHYELRYRQPALMVAAGPPASPSPAVAVPRPGAPEAGAEPGLEEVPGDEYGTDPFGDDVPPGAEGAPPEEIPGAEGPP